MKTVKVYQYRVKDPITGRRYLTRYKLTEEEAAERYPERACPGRSTCWRRVLISMLTMVIEFRLPADGDGRSFHSTP
jgi:hypothetical protein